MEKLKPTGSLVTELKSINVEGAVILRESALKKATLFELNGFLVVYSRTGMQETSQAIGAASPLNVKIAEAKIKTVLAVRRSSSIQRDRMKAKGQTRGDFGGQLGSLFGGGVAIFADKELSQFIGAVAFSGGTEEEDEFICRKAVEEAGLFTDLSPDKVYSINL